MADMMATERALTYSEPSMYQSKDWVTVQRVQRPLSGFRAYTQGQRVTITMRNPGQNEVLNPDHARFECAVITTVTSPSSFMWKYDANSASHVGLPLYQADIAYYPTSGRNAHTAGLPMANALDAACNLPGLPAWGFPYLSVCRVTIPGISMQDFLTADVESQWQVATRLLCSGGVGTFPGDGKTGKLGFTIQGEAEAAGARGVDARAGAVFAQLIRTNRVRAGPFGSTDTSQMPVRGANIPPGGVVYQPLGGPLPDVQFQNEPLREGDFACRGNFIEYSVPLSLLTFLFNSASNMIPLGLYSASPDTLSFQMEFAPASSALVNVGVERPDVCGPAEYRVVDPKISYSTVQINNTAVMAQLEMLFRGLASIPITPTESAPLAMTMKFIDYFYTNARVEAPVGPFALTLPGNQPSVRAIALRFCAEGVRRAGHYTGTVPLDYQWYTTGPANDNPLRRIPIQPVGLPSATVPGVTVSSRNWALYSRQGLNFHYGINNVPLVPNVWSDYSTGDGQWGGKYLLSLVPVLQNLQVKIGAYRVPLDALSDDIITLTNPFPGFETVENLFIRFRQFYVGQQTFAPELTSPFVVHHNLGGDSFRFYKQARNDFSPFAAREDPYDGPIAALLFYGSSRGDDARSQLLEGSSLIYPHEAMNYDYGVVPEQLPLPQPSGGQSPAAKVNNTFMEMREFTLLDGRSALRDWEREHSITWCVDGTGVAFATNNVSYTVRPTPHGNLFPGMNRPQMVLPHCAGPNLLLIPFETIAPVYNHQDDAFALRGLDLRSISGIEVTGRIVGVSNGQPGYGINWREYQYNADFTTVETQVNPRNLTKGQISDQVAAQSWTIRAMEAYDRMNVILPGRTDMEAQFSLISTGNTAIPSGGAPSF